MSTTRRRLVFVDLENMLGCSPKLAAKQDFNDAYRALAAALGLGTDDLVVVGVHPRWAHEAHEASPGARLVTRGGPDGADLRLIAELDDLTLICRRFSEVVVASGDWRFLGPITVLNSLGIVTTVAARRGTLATCIRLAAQNVVWLPPTEYPKAA